MSLIETYYTNKKHYLSERKKVEDLTKKEGDFLESEEERLEKFYKFKTTTPEEKQAIQTERDNLVKENIKKMKNGTNGVPNFYESFDTPKDIIKKSEYVLTLFYSPSCGFCRKIQPELQKVKEFYDGMVGFRAWNCKERKECEQYGVNGYPHLILFKNEQEIGRLRGYKPQEEIEKFIDEETSKTLSFGSPKIL